MPWRRSVRPKGLSKSRTPPASLVCERIKRRNKTSVPPRFEPRRGKWQFRGALGTASGHRIRLPTDCPTLRCDRLGRVSRKIRSAYCGSSSAGLESFTRIAPLAFALRCARVCLTVEIYSLTAVFGCAATEAIRAEPIHSARHCRGQFVGIDSSGRTTRGPRAPREIRAGFFNSGAVILSVKSDGPWPPCPPRIPVGANRG